MKTVAMLGNQEIVKTGEQGRPGTTSHVVRARTLSRTLSRREAVQCLILPFLFWQTLPRELSSDCKDESLRQT